MPFVKGQSGNPAGRPRGCRNKINRRAEFELGTVAPYFMGNLITHAKNGSPTAMRLVAERMMPVSRQRPVELALPPLTSAADRAPAVAQISQALAAGEITIGEANGLIRYVRDALALIPASPADAQSADLAGEVAQLRRMVTQLAAQLSGPGSQAASEERCGEEKVFADKASPNNQADQNVAAASGETASMESMQDQSAPNNAGSIKAQSIEINEEATAPKQTAGPACADVTAPASAPPVREAAPVNIRENTSPDAWGAPYH